MRAAIAVLIVVLVVGSCSRRSEDAEAHDCTPSTTEEEPLLGADVRADGSDNMEGWALVFATWLFARSRLLDT